MPDLPIATLERVANALDSLRVPYAVIGGVAVSIRSVPRFTTDVDAVLWVGEDGWTELLEGMVKQGFHARAEDPIAFARRNRLLLLTDADDVKVDFSFGALPFEEEMIRNAEPIEISPGCFASIASAEALVVMKAIAWRPKDRTDIVEIVSINPTLDWATVIEVFAEYAELLEVPERVDGLRAIIADAR